MNGFDQALEVLAQQAGRGDTVAQVKLQEQLEPEIKRIVRHTLQHGVASSTLGRRILATAHRLIRQGCAEGDSLIGRITHDLSRGLATRMGTKQAGQHCLETVCN